VHQNKN